MINIELHQALEDILGRLIMRKDVIKEGILETPNRAYEIGRWDAFDEVADMIVEIREKLAKAEAEALEELRKEQLEK